MFPDFVSTTASESPEHAPKVIKLAVNTVGSNHFFIITTPISKYYYFFHNPYYNIKKEVGEKINSEKTNFADIGFYLSIFQRIT